MAFLSSMDISASALTAQRLRMDVVAENVANINTTRTESGEPYRRQYVVFQSMESNTNQETFASHLNRAMSVGSKGGVRVTSIEDDTSAFTLDYNPTHPDADEDGYVRMPNVELVREMADMMSATRSYEANVTVFNATKNMAMTALDIGK